MRKKDEQFPILLGKACANEAGQPYQQVIQKLGNQLMSSGSVLGGLLGTNIVSMILGGSSNLSSDVALSQLLAAVPDSVRPSAVKAVYRLLQQYYGSLPVPLFYQDLGAILKAGYFSRVITTNYDNLLEQALESTPVPWRRDRDYHVIDVPAFTREALKRHLASLGRHGVLILKMHGDLRQEGDPIDFTELESALFDHRKTLYQELSEDLVVVGYERESPGIDKALHAQSGGTIWWVSETAIDPTLQSTLEAVRAVNVIDGPEASPQRLFGTLWTLLSRLPDAAGSGYDHSVDQQTLDSVVPGETDPNLPSTDLEHDVLRASLARAKDELERLRQSSPPGANPNIDAQIDYQRAQIASLEDQVRIRQKDKIQSLLNDILGRARTGSLDPATLAFLEQEANLVESQFPLSSPNQDIISASIAAIAVLSARLGPLVAPPESVRELSSFAPSELGRGL
jgi:hypothetical protein